MDGLNGTMPRILVLMNNIEPAPGGPPRVGREKQLVDPAWADQKLGYCSVIHARIFVFAKLREDVNFVARSQAINKRHGITLGPTSRCRKIPTQNGNLQASVEGNTS